MIAPPGYSGLVRVAAGRQATVFRARSDSLACTVALKAFPARALGAAREVAALRALSGCPHVVRLLDVASHLGCPWVTTSWCPSTPSRLTARLVAEAAAGLAAMHARRVVHGDVKPSNLLLDDTGSVRWADFGVSSCPSLPAPVGGGSPRFLAPELGGGGPPTPAGDVYALGATVDDLRDRDDGVLAALARRLTAPDPALRPSSADIVDLLGPGRDWLGGWSFAM